MLEVEKWSQDKNAAIALFATQTAAMARHIHEALQNVRERRVFEYQFPLPDFPTWFHLYSRPAKTLPAYLKLVSEFSDFGNNLVTIGLAGRQAFKMAKHNPDKLAGLQLTPEDMKAGQEFWSDTISKSFAEIRENITGTPFDHETREKFLEFSSANATELSFVLLVFAPCWLLYQASPKKLYDDAQGGDIDALVKLIRIDPLLLHDPKLGRHIQELRLKNKTNEYERVLDAARKPLKFSRKKMKTSFSALISSLANALDKPLTEPQLRDLQDTLAQDAEGELVDTDLPESPEAFAKAIQRHKPQWEKILHPDKTK